MAPFGEQCIQIILLMNTGPATKTCKMCCMEIPEKARKCPHCHSFQDRLSQVLYHPGVMLAALPVFIMVIFFARMFDKGRDFELYKDQVIVTESQLALGDTKSGATIAVLGTIKNNSPVPWEDIQFHVEFFDAQGRRVDVGDELEYSFRLSAHETSSFKVSFRREFPETNYVKHVVRVAGAKDAGLRW
jgi:hypothetical protein